MDYEKEYKEALERAMKELQSCGSTDCDAARQIFRLFPELKESEDKRIRKEILFHFKETIENIRSEEIIPQDAKILAGKMQNWIAWLEKQGEQRHDNKVEPKFKIEKCKWYVCIRNLYDNYANKVFCEGDIYLSTQDGSLIPCNSNVPYKVVCPDTYFRDWTIQDAKDGDILMANAPFIFNGNLEGGIGCPGAHCGINTLGKFQIPKYQEHWTGHTTTPSTKEQRDLLFQKMKEAGYEWNAEKKELKKIEQKPVELSNGEDYGIDGTYSALMESDVDLFFANEEGLSEFEKQLGVYIYYPRLSSGFNGDEKKYIRDAANTLLSLARKEIEKEDWRTPLRAYKNGYEQGKRDTLKDLPKWKKATENKEFDKHILLFQDEESIVLTTEIYKGEYYIEEDDLKTLPKE